MDTVVVGDGWTKDPFAADIEEHQDDTIIYGRGACDMKSGLACILTVLKDLDRKLKEEMVLSCPGETVMLCR